MHILRKIGLVMASTLFKIVLLLFTIAGALTLTFQNPSGIKTALDKSNAYSTAVDSAVIGLEKQVSKPQPGEDQHIDTAVLSKGVRTALTPQVVQNASEQFIDGVYHWLEGKSEQPDFKVDLSSAKQAFIASVTQSARERLTSLPSCTVEQLRTMDVNEIDPLSTPCLPPGFNIDQAVQKASNDLANSEDFLDDTVITADDLGALGGKQGQKSENIFEKFSFLPKIYGLMQPVLWLTGLGLVLLALAMIFLDKDRRSGIKKVAVTLVVMGILFGVSLIAYGFIFKKANVNNPNTPPALVNVITQLIGQFNQALLWFVGTYIVLGTAMLVALRLTRPAKIATNDEKTNSVEEKPNSEDHQQAKPAEGPETREPDEPAKNEDQEKDKS